MLITLTGNVGTWTILWAIEGNTFLLTILLQCFAWLPGLAVPWMIGELCTFFEDESLDIWYGIYLSLGLLVLGVVRIEFGTIAFAIACRVKTRVIALISYVVYHKAVRVAMATNEEMTMGQKITLLAADSRMIAVALAFEPMFISLFVLIFLICVFLHIQIGISALAGWIFVLLVSFPVQGVMGGKLVKAWKAYIGESDKRYILCQIP